MEKEIITAYDYGKLRRDFIRERIEQFTQRKNISYSEVLKMMESDDFDDQVDLVVDDCYKITNIPDVNKYTVVWWESLNLNAEWSLMYRT